MGMFDFLKTKSAQPVEQEVDLSPEALGTRYKFTLQELEQVVSSTNCGSNLLTLYHTIPEVAFPVNYIASRVVNGKFQLKKTSDDSIVFDNKEINKFLTKPNPLQSFNEFLKTYVAYKLITGNSFIKAAMSRDIKSKDIWKWCSSYWVLPPNHVQIITPSFVPLFSTASLEDIISCYRLSFGNTMEDIPPRFILHSKELCTDYFQPLRGVSRLASQKKPISNLIAVYQARNIIYTKRGALGFIVSKKEDESGSIAFTPGEKEAIQKEYDKVYGVSSDKSPVGIINQDADFLRMNLSISELEPFKETLNDATSIAGAFSLSSELVPREGNSTFNNQNTAEKKAYTSAIIPEGETFARDITEFLHLEDSGLYIDVDYSGVDVLKDGFKDEQQTKSIISKRCKDEFTYGVISLNDWRAQIGEDKVDNPLYDKLTLEMSEEELSYVMKIYMPKYETASNNKGANNNSLQNQGK